MRVTTPQLTIHAEVTGQGDPLVLLHSLAMDARMWQPLVDRLGSSFRCFALDARGHGNTGWDGQPFTVTDLADDVLAALDALELDRPHLLGLAMGGSAALTFAGRYPHRVRGLALADTTAWYGPGAPGWWEQRAQAALTRPRADLLGFQLDRWFTDGFRSSEPGEVERITGLFTDCDSHAHAAACRALGGMDSRELLPAIRARTLVLAGEEDYATPPDMSRAIADAVPGAWLRLIPGIRHMSLIEKPGLAGDIADHLAACRRHDHPACPPTRLAGRSSGASAAATANTPVLYHRVADAAADSHCLSCRATEPAAAPPRRVIIELVRGPAYQDLQHVLAKFSTAFTALIGSYSDSEIQILLDFSRRGSTILREQALDLQSRGPSRHTS